MRWFFLCVCVGVGLTALAARLAQALHQCRAKQAQLVDLLLLLVDHVVELLRQVVLAGQFDFNFNEAIFDTHAVATTWKPPF